MISYDSPNFYEISNIVLDESHHNQLPFDNSFDNFFNSDGNFTEENNRFDEFENPLNPLANELDQIFYHEQEKELLIFEEPIKSTKENSETNPALSESESSKKSKKSKKKSKIFDISKVKKEKTKETPQFLGKKRQAENHSKFAFDNLVRKIKSKLFGTILDALLIC